MNNQIKEGSIELDNQSIVVRILMPSGRVHVTDKVTGYIWSMHPGNKSGEAVLNQGDEPRENKTVGAVLEPPLHPVLNQEEGPKEYKFGISGKRGIQFTKNYYMMRSTGEEDFHDVSLTGNLGDDPSTNISIRFLISTTFPVLNCFCYTEGPRSGEVDKISFPLGWHLPDSFENHIYLPHTLEDFLKMEFDNMQERLWEPSPQEEHRIVGSPFFIATKGNPSDSEKSCGVIGYHHHPLYMLEIRRGRKGRFATSTSARLDETGKSETNPFHIRYQFVPTANLKAISWLCWEQLMTQTESPNLQPPYISE